VFTNCDRPVEAVRLCKKALRLNPLSPALYLNHLGLAYLDSGQFEQAVDILKKSIEKKPNGLFNRLNLIIAYIALGQEEKARRHALKILEIDPEFSVESYVQVIPHKNQENLKIAAEALRMAGLQ